MFDLGHFRMELVFNEMGETVGKAGLGWKAGSPVGTY